MKMERRENIESFDEQEARAQRRLSVGALVKAALLAGVLVFVVPAGGPWMSQEAFVNVMGRGMGNHPLPALLGHFTLTLLYGWIIGMCIFSQPLAAGILFGALMALPLYGLNYVLLAAGAGFRANEIHVGIAHFMFCLFFSVAYRGLAVQRPRRKDGSEPAKAGGLGT